MYAILKSVYLYRPQRLPATFSKKCTPISDISLSFATWKSVYLYMSRSDLLQIVYTYICPAAAGNLSKMHTYIYPVLSCCKLCTPIPAPAFAGILFQKCTPIYTQTPPRLCRQPSRFERLCPDFVASIGAHFFSFSFSLSSAALCAAICIHFMSGGIC